MGAKGEACSASLRAACKADSHQQLEAFHYNYDNMKNQSALVQQLAGFLLMRGNYSWFGYGFQGCSKPYFRSCHSATLCESAMRATICR